MEFFTILDLPSIRNYSRYFQDENNIEVVGFGFSR